ncbi:hypothetical protein [Streptomyces sp. NBC_01565]|nr:hypothetical protein [Streptomyces sp. NBC_01565]MCX4545944.1 hypothetical protein [Streptomyces sp. NBC_01565]
MIDIGETGRHEESMLLGAAWWGLRGDRTSATATAAATTVSVGGRSSG